MPKWETHMAVGVLGNWLLLRGKLKSLSYQKLPLNLSSPFWENFVLATVLLVLDKGTDYYCIWERVSSYSQGIHTVEHVQNKKSNKQKIPRWRL